MFRSALFSLFFAATLFGGVLDFRTLDKAKEAYAKGQYKEAAALYESIEDKNDDLRFNLGDAYYKEQKYDAAVKQYEQVKKSALRAKALHNMGNAYAKSKKSDEAIAAYEEALKLNKDEDTAYNLELLKKQKEQQKKKEQQKQDKKDQKKHDDKKKDQENKKSGQQKQDQNSDQKSEEKRQDKNGDQQKSQNEKQQDEEAKKEEQAKKDELERQDKEEESKKEKSEKEQRAMQQNEAKEEPISDMQERKYENRLKKRGIRTLMVPLKTKGARDEETTAW